MSRREKWNQAREALMGRKSTGVDEREAVPEICCGKCQNWSENAYGSDGRGTCKILKIGSNLEATPPVYVLEGDAGLITFFNMDTSKCSHFVKMELIDTDGTECADPQYRRAMRQMEKQQK